MVSEKKIYFPIISLLGANGPQGVPSLDPRGLIGRIYVVDHYTLLHIKYLSSGPYGFREEDFLSSLWVLMSPGCGQFGPKGHGWQDLYRRPLNIASDLIY